MRTYRVRVLALVLLHGLLGSLAAARPCAGQEPMNFELTAGGGITFPDALLGKGSDPAGQAGFIIAISNGRRWPLEARFNYTRAGGPDDGMAMSAAALNLVVTTGQEWRVRPYVT